MNCGDKKNLRILCKSKNEIGGDDILQSKK